MSTPKDTILERARALPRSVEPYRDLWDDIEAAGELDDELEARLRTVLDDYKSRGDFTTATDAADATDAEGTGEEAAVVAAVDAATAADED